LLGGSLLGPSASRPDVVRTLSDGTLEAIEVKYYDLENPSNVANLCNTLKRQVATRVSDLPGGSSQRIVLDVNGRGYSKELVESVQQRIWDSLADVYPNIPIDIRW